MLKQYKQFLLSIGYTVADESEHLLVMFHKELKLVISITIYKRNKDLCIICKETVADTRFNGIISNAVQLKSLLGMIKEAL